MTFASISPELNRGFKISSASSYSPNFTKFFATATSENLGDFIVKFCLIICVHSKIAPEKSSTPPVLKAQSKYSKANFSLFILTKFLPTPK